MIKDIGRNCVQKGIVRLIVMGYPSSGRIVRCGLGKGKDKYSRELCAPTIQSIVSLFPKWSVDEADGLWCAAFVYYCVILAGFQIPVRPKESSCSLAGCGAWEEWAQADSRIKYYSGNGNAFHPAAGDIVLFDRVFDNTDHDHIGIVLENYDDYIVTAEGNVGNISRILEHKKDGHIRAYIRIPDNFLY